MGAAEFQFFDNLAINVNSVKYFEFEASKITLHFTDNTSMTVEGDRALQLTQTLKQRFQLKAKSVELPKI